jgi:hypothetical protein
MKIIEAIVNSIMDAHKSITEAIEKKRKEQRVERFQEIARRLDNEAYRASYQIVTKTVSDDVFLKFPDGSPILDLKLSIAIDMNELGTLSRCYRYALREKISSEKVQAMGREWKNWCSYVFNNSRFTGLVYQFEIPNTDDIFLMFVFVEKEYEQNFRKYMKNAKFNNKINL